MPVPNRSIPGSIQKTAAGILKHPQSDPLNAAATLAWPVLFAQGLLPRSGDARWHELCGTMQRLSAEIPSPVPVLAMTEGTRSTSSPARWRSPGPPSTKPVLCRSSCARARVSSPCPRGRSAPSSWRGSGDPFFGGSSMPAPTFSRSTPASFCSPTRIGPRSAAGSPSTDGPWTTR